MTQQDPALPPPPSLVLLLKAARTVAQPVVRAAAERAFGVSFASEPAGRRYVAPYGKGRGKDGRYVVRFTDYMLGVTCGDRPYWPDPTFGPDLLGDPRARAAVVAHQGWVAVDSLGLIDAGPMVVPPDRKGDVYRVASRLALELFNLAEEDCTALVVPEVRRVYPNGAGFADETPGPAAPPANAIRDMLSAKDPALLLGIKGPALLEEDDPRIRAAVEEARRRLPEFLKAWEGRSGAAGGGGGAGGGEARPFMVKGTFSDEHGGEQMWVAVTSIESGVATGTLQSAPSYVKCVREGQKVQLKLEDVVDFLYHDGRAMAGAFTDRVICDIMEGRR